MIQPISGYVYGEEIKKVTGVVTTAEVSDTKQRYKVLAHGGGFYDHGQYIDVEIDLGMTVIIQKHAAEGDTPPDMLSGGRALFHASRIMAYEAAE